MIYTIKKMDPARRPRGLLSLPVEVLLQLDLGCHELSVLTRVCKYLRSAFHPKLYSTFHYNGSTALTARSYHRLLSFLRSIGSSPDGLINLRHLSIAAWHETEPTKTLLTSITRNAFDPSLLSGSPFRTDFESEVIAVLTLISAATSLQELSLSVPSGRKTFLMANFSHSITDLYLENRNDSLVARPIQIVDIKPLFQLPLLERLHLLNFTQQDWKTGADVRVKRWEVKSTSLRHLGLYNCTICPEALEGLLGSVPLVSSLCWYRWLEPGYRRECHSYARCSIEMGRLKALSIVSSSLRNLEVVDDNIVGCSCFQALFHFWGTLETLEVLTIHPVLLCPPFETNLTANLDDLRHMPVSMAIGLPRRYSTGATFAPSLKHLTLVLFADNGPNEVIQSARGLASLLLDALKWRHLDPSINVNFEGLRRLVVDLGHRDPHQDLELVYRLYEVFNTMVLRLLACRQRIYPSPALRISFLDLRDAEMRVKIPEFFRNSLSEQNMTPSWLAGL